MAVSVLLLSVLSWSIVQSSIPISYPDDWQNTHGLPPYNMIEVYPNCYYGGYCPFLYVSSLIFDIFYPGNIVCLY